MPLTRQKKEEIVQSTTEQMKSSAGVIFTDFTGVNVESLRKLRTGLLEKGAKYQVTKRSLTRIALGKAGVDVQNNIEKTSQGLVFFPEDLPGTAKVLYEYGKEQKNFKILNAYNAEEERWMDAEEVITLAKLPSYEELIGRLMFMMQAPLKKFAMVVDQIAKQKAEGGESSSSDEKAEEDKKEENGGEENAETPKTEEDEDGDEGDSAPEESENGSEKKEENAAEGEEESAEEAEKEE